MIEIFFKQCNILTKKKKKAFFTPITEKKRYTFLSYKYKCPDKKNINGDLFYNYSLIYSDRSKLSINCFKMIIQMNSKKV